MLNIRFLEGFAGLRLKDDKPLSIKPGINLLVGRNGSGKSNLARLINFVFSGNMPAFNGRQLLEEEFIDRIEKKTISAFRARLDSFSREVDKKATNIENHDFGETVMCLYQLDEKENKIIVAGNRAISPRSVSSNFSEAKFTSGLFDIRLSEPSDKHLVTEITPQINLNDASINISTNFTLFGSSDNANPIVNSIIENFNNYFNEQLIDFRLNNESLNKKLNELKHELLYEYGQFFDSVGKKIELTLDPSKHGGRALVIKDGVNTIGFDKLSDGEKNLFNLIINLATARQNKPKLLIFDEPEIFMHDDMIDVLVNEFERLSKDLPNSTLMILSHSSALIEKLANLGSESVNLISIINKQIQSSSNDLAFINSLSANGVRFSPLYLSKAVNIFIENYGEDAKRHADYLLKFFDNSNSPNIIPIGSSGEVKNFDKVKSVFENVIKTKIAKRNIGLIDGDIWLSEKLINISLEEIFSEIANVGEVAFIPVPESENLFYLNFWEIENLYLQQEILGKWINNETNQYLDIENYKKIIIANKLDIIDAWMKTIGKIYNRPLYFRSLEKYGNDLKDAGLRLRKYEMRLKEIEPLLFNLFDMFLNKNITAWFPGKELLKRVSANHKLSVDDIDFGNLNISNRIREIML